MTSWGKYLVSRDTVLIVTQRVIDGPSTSCMTVVKFLSSCMTVVKFLSSCMTVVKKKSR
jgi:hypothetical protein